MYKYKIDGLRLKDVRELIRNGCDFEDNQIIITDDGYVYLDTITYADNLYYTKFGLKDYILSCDDVGIYASEDKSRIQFIFDFVTYGWRHNCKGYYEDLEHMVTSTIQIKKYKVDTLTLEEVSEMIRNGIYSINNQVIVNNDGYVYLSCKREHEPDVKFYFETFGATTDDVGFLASKDKEHIQRIYNSIVISWKKDFVSLVDMDMRNPFGIDRATFNKYKEYNLI